jgi:beta-N-acetylhexosaminidase
MTDGQLAAQVIMTGIDAAGPLSEGERARLRRVPAGAVMLFGKNLGAGAESIRLMTRELSALLAIEAGEGSADGTEGDAADGDGAEDDAAGVEKTVRPFIAVDHEGGDVQRVAEGRLPAPLSYWEMAGASGRDAALLAVERDAEEAGRALSALGINMNLAPLAETLRDGNRLFLGTRSYGPDAAFVADAAAAFIRGMGRSGAACVIKHFPGNSDADPHIEASRLALDAEGLKEAAAPFAALIDAGLPAAVMVSHAVVPAWDAENPASLSQAVIGKLREGQGAGVIILADDFSMGAAGAGVGNYRTEAKAVAALAAGADMVMAWPRNLVSTHETILKALSDGTLPRSRLQDAAARVIARKTRRPPQSAK